MDVFSTQLFLQSDLLETILNQQPAAFGWVSLILFVLWQLYAPKLGIDTRLSEIVGSVNARIDDVGERIDDVEERQEMLVGVTEVIAVEQGGVDGEYVKSLLNNTDVNPEKLKDENE